MENKLLMKLVVGTEAMFFISLIMAFVYFSNSPGFKAHQLASLNIKTTGIFTLVLFSSSFTYWRAERNYNSGNMKMARLWLVLTILFGTIFLGGQAKEYYHLLHNQVTISSSMFGTGFFTLTGFHGLHVFVGLIIITIITTLAFLGDYDNRKSTVIATIGIYWHFVDIVWFFVFIIVYVLPYFR